MGTAIADYNMIEAGDRVMVCLSGGKDSYGMLDILLNLQKSAPVSFELVAVNLDQKQPGFPEHVLPEYLAGIGVPYHIVEKDTYSVVREKVAEGKTSCGLCSRLRRGTLYAFAERIGASKIALGHHKDDIVETLFLNMFYAGEISTMSPRQEFFKGAMTIIRPLAFLDEDIIRKFSKLMEFPVLVNPCPSARQSKRQAIKKMLAELYRTNRKIRGNIFRALHNVKLDYLL